MLKLPARCPSVMAYWHLDGTEPSLMLCSSPARFLLCLPVSAVKETDAYYHQVYIFTLALNFSLHCFFLQLNFPSLFLLSCSNKIQFSDNQSRPTLCGTQPSGVVSVTYTVSVCLYYHIASWNKFICRMSFDKHITEKTVTQEKRKFHMILDHFYCHICVQQIGKARADKNKHSKDYIQTC